MPDGTTASYPAQQPEPAPTWNGWYWHTRAKEARAEIERTRPLIESALALRDANTDDDIVQAWADFDQAVDDYRAAADV